MSQLEVIAAWADDLHGYAEVNRSGLLSPTGAPLTDEVVALLAEGPGRYRLIRLTLHGHPLALLWVDTRLDVRALMASDWRGDSDLEAWGSLALASALSVAALPRTEAPEVAPAES